MCRVYVQSKAYPLYDGYKLNTEKANIRYEIEMDSPIKYKTRIPGKMECECGNCLVPLAYKYNDGVEQSQVLIGRKCIKCGTNYFTDKTVSRFPRGFAKDENDVPEDIPYKIKGDEVRRGDVYYADLNGIESYCGSEQTGKRPVLVIQNNKGNKFSETTIVAVITSKEKKQHFPTHVKLPDGVLPKESVACMEQIKTIDKKRLGDFLGNIYEVTSDIDTKINMAIKTSLELI